MVSGSQHPRSVVRHVPARATTDGAGVRLFRSIGGPDAPELDPFLLLDSFMTENADDYIAGFPDHPHRGFETVTYMVEGRMRHRDNKGNSGLLKSGGAQWMTAGRGIVHSEMPEQEDGRMSGFQLWVNLPAARKMTEPRYQDIEPEDVPEVALPGGGRARIVAGEAFGATGPVTGIAIAPLYLDLALTAGESVDVPVPPGHTAFAFVFEGNARVGAAEDVVPPMTLAVLGDGDSVGLTAVDGPARLILVAGAPIGEPIARHGPFVMNTRDELIAAFRDFQAGRF